ncbi:hypothetical protein ACH347_34245 [Saccharopolyspora sp. 5N102]|uniref:hypothetical protein n=1 Tax=Saccharopolyspora sp. 5N102 TaxID=3375155 RepID=UPI003795B81E
MTIFATRVREFAAILAQRCGADLHEWIAKSRADALPAFYSYLDSNRPAEGVNTKVKMRKCQTYGRASFTLLRRRILFAQ